MKLTVPKPTVSFTEGDLEARADWVDIQTQSGETLRLVDLANGTIALSSPTGTVTLRASNTGALILEATA